MKKKALDTIQNTHDQLGDIIEQDKGRLLDSIKTLEKRIMADTKRLVSGKDGKLVGPRTNLKQAHQIHADLVKNFKETYEDTAFRVTKGYNQSVSMVKNVYKDLDVSMKFTGIDRDMISELQKRSYNEYLAYGKAAQESISQAMYNSVLTKGSYEDLVGSVSAALTGHLSKSGRPMSAYADVWANDGIMNFHQSVLMKKGNDAGLTSYLYVGNVMDATRPFCAERAMQTFTQEEIESWDFNWKGKSGPALTNRGGWNCRHHWQPVKKEDVETLENEIAEDKEIQEDIKSKIEDDLQLQIDDVKKELSEIYSEKPVDYDRVVIQEDKLEELLEERKKILTVVREPELEEPIPEYQSFDPRLESVNFDWDSLDVRHEDISVIQKKMIQKRFADSGNEISVGEANEILVATRNYTSELYTEYREWSINPEAYRREREDWQADLMEDISTNLRNYTENTLPFDPTVNLYRGQDSLGSLTEVRIGDEVDLTHLSSFSTDEEVAKTFSEGGESPTIMVLNKDNEFKSASLAEFSESGYEKEVLLSDTNRLVCTDIEEIKGTKYMYFDSVEVTEEQREIEEELEEEIEKDKEIQEDIKPKIEVPEIEEAPEYQTFDKDLDSVDFDWKALDIEPDDVPDIQNKIIQSRLDDSGIETSEEEADDIRRSLRTYTSGRYREFGQWLREPEKIEKESPEVAKEFSDMKKNLNKYINETQPFDPNVTLYRGKNELGSLEGLEVGGEIDLKYFSSFSTDETLAEAFTADFTSYKQRADGGTPVVMVINPGNETYSSSIAEFSRTGYEREVLLSDKNRLVCTSFEDKIDEEGRSIKYMYFDSVEVTEEQREVEEELEEEKVAKEEAEKKLEEERIAREEAERVAEEERLAKEETERVMEEERLAKEEVEKKLEEEQLAKEAAERRAEEERLAKEEAEKKLVPEEVEEEPLGYVKGKDQVFNKAFAKSGFDWESIEDDYDKIEKKQLKILKQRLESSDIKLSKAELESMFTDGIHKYTGSGKFEGFQEWIRDRSEYPDVKTLNEFRTMERHLNKYINETPSFTSKEPIYRGTSLSHELYKDLEVGDTIQPTGFTSWSASAQEAHDFAVEDTSEGAKVEDPVILQINKGNQSYSSSIAEFSAFGSEQEVLLSDRNKLILTNVEEKDGIKYMYFDTVDITVQEVEAMEEERRLEDEKLKPEEDRRIDEEAAADNEEAKEEAVAKGWVEPTHEEGYSVVKGDFQNFDSTYVENNGSYEEEDKELDNVRKSLIKERYQDNGVELSDKEVKKIFTAFDGYSYNKTDFEKWLKDPSGDFDKKEIKEFEAMKKSFNSYLDNTRNFNPNMDLYHGFTNYNENPTFNTLKVGDKLDAGEFSVWTSSSESSKSDADPSSSWDENPDSTIAVISKGNEMISSSISEISEVGGKSAIMVSGKNDLVLEKIEEKDGTRYMYFTAKDGRVK